MLIVYQFIAQVEAIQVAAGGLADEKTRKREIRGLVECCQAFALKEGTIITLDTREELGVGGIRVKIVPLYRWLLGQG